MHAAQQIILFGAPSSASGSSPTYTGPGDVVASAVGWWGLRAYSAASVGANAIRLRRSGDNLEQNFVTLADGSLDVASITTFKGAANLFMVTIYDQVGTQHMTQATAATQAPFTLNALGTRPMIDTSASAGVPQDYVSGSTFPAVNQPFTFSTVYKFTGTLDNVLFGATNYSIQIRPGFGSSTNLGMAATNSVAFVVPNATMVGVDAIFNGAASNGYVNGTIAGAAIDVGANNLGVSTMSLFRSGAPNNYVGLIGEIGVWPGAFSAGQATSMNTNQHAYWGF